MTTEDRNEFEEREASPPRDPAADARAELREAVQHAKQAASLLLERAATDPTLKQASVEAERVIRQIGESAEPVVREMGAELGRLGRWLEGTVSQLARPKRSRPADDFARREPPRPRERESDDETASDED